MVATRINDVSTEVVVKDGWLCLTTAKTIGDGLEVCIDNIIKSKSNNIGNHAYVLGRLYNGEWGYVPISVERALALMRLPE